jgi:hypothetical protein
MRRLVAKAARHSAARARDLLGPDVWDQRQDLEDGAYRTEGPLMAMAVQQDGRPRIPQRHAETTGRCLSRNKLFEHQGVRRDEFSTFPQAHREAFIAQRQQARRFKADDRN